MNQIRTEPTDVTDRLTALGLRESELAEVVRRGYLAFASCTPNHPPLYPGFSAWATMVCALREILLPQDWSRLDDNNYPLTVNPTGSLAIAVATGDEATGRADAVPSTKSSKGPSTVEAVATNQQQLDLPFPPFVVPDIPATADEPHMTWILLVHRGQGEVRFELSLPTSMGTDGRVTGWRERIILQAVPTDPEAMSATPPKEDLPDINVDVKRRA